MRRVRVSVTLGEDIRDRLCNEAKAVPESLDAYLGRLILHGAALPDSEVVEELRQARTEARVRAQELGQARRQNRELQVRLNSLHAVATTTLGTRPPWSLDESGRSAEELEAWWRWLRRGVDRLRRRYGLVEVDYKEYSERRARWWWESAIRVRTIATAVAWEEALDLGGDGIPTDPRYAEGFVEYVVRLLSSRGGPAELGRYHEPSDGDLRQSQRDLIRRESQAFEVHVAARLSLAGRHGAIDA